MMEIFREIELTKYHSQKGLHPEFLHSSRKIDASKEPLPCPSFPDLDIVTANEARGINVDDCLKLSIYTRKVSQCVKRLLFSVQKLIKPDLDKHLNLV